MFGGQLIRVVISPGNPIAASLYNMRAVANGIVSVVETRNHAAIRFHIVQCRQIINGVVNEAGAGAVGEFLERPPTGRIVAVARTVALRVNQILDLSAASYV